MFRRSDCCDGIEAEKGAIGRLYVLENSQPIRLPEFESLFQPFALEAINARRIPNLSSKYRIRNVRTHLCLATSRCEDPDSKSERLSCVLMCVYALTWYNASV
jgi:hypothetical protein